ncbi:putative metal-dependent hydrolase [Flavobacterium circumlabens]|uniref:DinB family protein n=1 Tax=Flavobacterium circumlabens TaxID=2133765 RepID=A0A4Y7U9D8_9FLAO|nr:putative metal-dependent hydrolase [Flavobacterium circumlabens]TCN53976.1 DinB family protein [Flavobacterium circumlabens]TEB42439.1 putative metal-dependent hydrolase [Flavobacterium circumlabens]
MENSDLEKLKYPIGKFIAPSAYSKEYLSGKMEEIAQFPEKLKQETFSLSDEQLDTPYRPGGWTVRQVIHHCAESHMNCFIRIKWALTENNPVIKAYDEVLWSALQDNLAMPIQPTLYLLEGLHLRLAYLLKSLSETDLERSFIHPESNSEIKIKQMIATYAWHGNHHLAHITTLKKDKNWK